MRILQRLFDVEPGRNADARVTALDEAHGFGIAQLFLDQVRKLEVLEHEVEILFLRELEDEVVAPLPLVAGFAAPAAPAARGPLDPIAGNELLVTGKHPFLAAATAVAEYGLGHVATRNADVLSAVGIGNAALADRVGYRFLDVFAVTVEKPAPVDRALVAAVRAPVDDQEGHVAASRAAGRLLRLPDPEIPLRQ